MTPVISVVIPTHNPRMDYLARVLEALRAQTLSREQWELLLIDNASREKVEGRVDIGWHPNARVVREERLGLTFARLRGFAEAKGELIVMVDDDNVLAPDYLENAVKIAEEHKDIGAFGGKCLPEFETPPEAWMEEFLPLLALRDHGDKEIVAGDSRSADGSRRVYPDQAAPIGAGMVLRSSAARAYAERLRRSGGLRVAGGESGGMSVAQAEQSPKDRNTELPNNRTASVITDRRGDSLASAGDNDLVFTILRDGWKVGYFPQLKVTHLIPSSRLTVDYLARANRGVQRSWVEVLRKHEACPWPVISRTSAPLRKVRAFFKCRGWQKPAGFTRWQACCGQFEGRIRS
jgi:glycosyltransferase involved in cell wall biosynthesis